MADSKKLALDKVGLQNFVNNDITQFIDSLDKIQNKPDAEGTPTIDDLLGSGQIPDNEDPIFHLQAPLAIGKLAADAGTGGSAIVDAIKKSGGSISDIYTQQTKLFNDLEKYLNTTITKLMDAQHDSLTKIDGKAFLDSLGTVPSDFGGTTGNGATT